MVSDLGTGSVGLWKNCTSGGCGDNLSYAGEGTCQDIVPSALEEWPAPWGLGSLTSSLPLPSVHRCPQGCAGLHDPVYHLLRHLPRGLRVPALHHGERQPLLPLRGHHAGVL